VHRDVKSGNCLVSLGKDGRVAQIKLADMGFACLKSTRSVRGGEGTIVYQAPEVMRGTGYTEKVDVYSFGMVLYELVLNRRPFDQFESIAAIVYNVAIKGARPTIPPDARLPQLLAIAVRCWADDPAARPAMHDICAELELLLAAAERDEINQ
jgi:serine/threonine protein kinase